MGRSDSSIVSAGCSPEAPADGSDIFSSRPKLPISDVSAFSPSLHGVARVQSAAVHERIRTLEQGQHLCLLYEHVDEQLAISVTYLTEGLRRGERCLFASDPATFTALRGAIASGGIDVDAQIRHGALLLLTKEQAHLRGGGFDLESMLGLLQQAVRDAVDAGYRGLRAAGDMSWILDNAPGTDQVVAYEAMMNEFYPTVPALGLCLYDRRRRAPTTLEGALRTHPSLVTGQTCCVENPYYEEPALILGRADPRGRFEWKLRQLTRV
jgi:hypothetical protein